jgi:hypothetical protein
MFESRKKRWLLGAGVALALIGGIAGVAVATGAAGDDSILGCRRDRGVKHEGERVCYSPRPSSNN